MTFVDGIIIGVLGTIAGIGIAGLFISCAEDFVVWVMKKHTK